MPEIKAVIFDLDGVLINSLPAHYKSYVKLYSRYGIKYPFSEFISKDITAGAMNAIPRVLAEHGKDSKEIRAILRQRRKSFRKLVMEKNQIIEGTPIRLYPGVLALLKSLKKNGYKLAVASGGSRFFVNTALRKNKIRGYFDAVITGEGLHRKPHPDIFIKAAKKLRTPAKNCLVIEDAHDGVAAARRAGMKVIGHKNAGYCQDLSHADKVVGSMAKINVKMIEKL
ncbi:MAG: HAD family phosphatase [Candidatus Aenigmarchaeota archaeon]|nr:HAD family phosphatase [Candidatus Aenigmarchaeota archaeon]